MKKYMLLIFSYLLVCCKLYSQIRGEYRGLFTQANERYKQVAEVDTIINGKASKFFALEKIEWDGEKKLTLLSNGRYFFGYRQRGEPCAARSSYRNCTGRYSIMGDTLCLTSTYRQTDFFSVVEKTIDSLPHGKRIIIAHYPNNKLSPATFINRFDLKLNDSLVGEFAINDTIHFAATEVSKLFFSCCSPYQMEWSYVPKNKGSNYFSVTLTREMNNENIFMDNCKLLLNGKKLIVLADDGYLSVKDNLYKKY